MWYRCVLASIPVRTSSCSACSPWASLPRESAARPPSASSRATSTCCIHPQNSRSLVHASHFFLVFALSVLLGINTSHFFFFLPALVKSLPQSPCHFHKRDVEMHCLSNTILYSNKLPIFPTEIICIRSSGPTVSETESSLVLTSHKFALQEKWENAVCSMPRKFHTEEPKKRWFLSFSFLGQAIITLGYTPVLL